MRQENSFPPLLAGSCFPTQKLVLLNQILIISAYSFHNLAESFRNLCLFARLPFYDIAQITDAAGNFSLI